MTAPQKLIARLNVPNIRFDVGSGGIPEMTAEDIAAALAAAPPLARSVFTLLWWQDGAALERIRILTELRNLAWEEQGRRCHAWRTASDRVAALREDLKHVRGSAEDLKREIVMAEARAHAARRRCWPRTNIGKYHEAVVAVLGELKSTRHCPKCGGREDVADGRGLKKTCDRCGGTGTVAYTRAARARALQLEESTFRKYWSDVYEWLYATINDLNQQAGRAMLGALKNGNE
jgi:hypothetical protein